VVSPHRANFVKTMLRLAAEREEVAVVADQRGCPTFAGDLAGAIARVTLALATEDGAPAGTYHFVNAGEATWHEFAAAVFSASARRGGPVARVRPISTAEYPTPAKRPANSRLATEKIRSAFGIAPRPWRDALGQTISALT
jgi:dTDP-4-dehydrorhamnose reductase